MENRTKTITCQSIFVLLWMGARKKTKKQLLCVAESKNRKSNQPVYRKRKISHCSTKQNTAPDGRDTKDERKQQLTCCSHAFQCLGVSQCFLIPSCVSPHLLVIPMLPMSQLILECLHTKKLKQYYLRERNTKKKQKQQSAAEKTFSDGAPEGKQNKTKTTINLCGLGWSSVPKLIFERNRSSPSSLPSL